MKYNVTTREYIKQELITSSAYGLWSVCKTNQTPFPWNEANCVLNENLPLMKKPKLPLGLQFFFNTIILQ